MPLTTATRLGPYEIVAPLGAGGMGEVYRARDTRLGREVAIKVLPASLTSSAEVRARFEREARTVSSLNHPHICTLHDVGREGDTDYLVMELVDGETLAQRLTRGALPMAEVLRIGGQIADALDRAHRAGVVHRDLKPGNVMLTRSGAKLMDFGLARATGMVAAPGSSSRQPSGSMLSQSPTMAQPLTAEGTIIGTFQYMAPEQLEGKEADARSDLWALGCVLYEMATGKRAFEGRSQASLIGAIMHSEPAPIAPSSTSASSLAPSPALERLVRQLLVKDPDERLQSAHDVKLQLANLVDGGSSWSAAAPVIPRGRASRMSLLPWAIAGLMALAAVAALLLARGRAPETTMMRFSIDAPAGVTLATDPGSSAISPDGRKLVFLAADSSGSVRLWLRPIESLTAQMIEGTDNALWPFWSPDSRFVGFFADGKLKKVSVEGGAPEVLCEAADGRGGTWGSRGTIVFAPIAAGPLMRIPAEGGEPVVVARPDSSRHETALRWPCFLPDGKHFTFVSLPSMRGNYDVQVGSTDGGGVRKLTTSASSAVWAEPGYILIVRNGRLLAQRIDREATRLIGDPVPIGTAPALIGPAGIRAVSVSRNGILVRPTAGLQNTHLVWVDRAGHAQGEIPLPPARWEAVVVSPDGHRATIERRSEPNANDLWMIDLDRSLATRFTFIPSSLCGNASWSPDGRWVAFDNNATGPYNIYRKLASGQGDEELLYQSSTPFKNLGSWTPDGASILFDEPSAVTQWDLWRLPVESERKPVPLVRTRFNESGGQISPDGTWMLYASDESGRPEVYAQSYPAGNARFQVSTNGASIGGWSHDGREIIFGGLDNSLLAAEVQRTPTFRIGAPRALFRLPASIIGVGFMPDAQRFIEVLPVGQTAFASIQLEVNWTAALAKQ
jgi:eukaryotic-like serine/threonine-protein kinase